MPSAVLPRRRSWTVEDYFSPDPCRGGAGIAGFVATGAPTGFGVSLGRGIEGARGTVIAGWGPGVALRATGGGGGGARFESFGAGGGGGRGAGAAGAGGGSLQPVSITAGAGVRDDVGPDESGASEEGAREIGMSSSSTWSSCARSTAAGFGVNVGAGGGGIAALGGATGASGEGGFGASRGAGFATGGAADVVTGGAADVVTDGAADVVTTGAAAGIVTAGAGGGIAGDAAGATEAGGFDGGDDGDGPNSPVMRPMRGTRRRLPGGSELGTEASVACFSSSSRTASMRSALMDVSFSDFPRDASGWKENRPSFHARRARSNSSGSCFSPSRVAPPIAPARIVRVARLPFEATSSVPLRRSMSSRVRTVATLI